MSNKDKKQNEKEQEVNISTDQQPNQTTTEEAAEQKTANEAAEQPLAEEKTDAEKLADAEAEIADLKNKLLYKQAEFENYRRRVIAEKTELILNGGQKVLAAMLPVVDDLERALQNMEKAEEVNAVKEGVDLIYKKFLTVLKAQGVTPIETEGADFNVDLHEAIAQLPAPTDDLKGKVLDCTQKGYMLNDKVLRFAQVAVAL